MKNHVRDGKRIDLGLKFNTANQKTTFRFSDFFRLKPASSAARIA